MPAIHVPARERVELSLPSAVEVSLIEVVGSLDLTGHGDKITLGVGRTDWGEDEGFYVTGYKTGALDRCARITHAGQIEWIR